MSNPKWTKELYEHPTTQHTPGLPTDTQWITETIRKAELFDTATTAGVMLAISSHADLLAALRSLTDEIEFSQLTSRLSDPSRRNVEAAVLRARAAIARVEGK